jgi:predicted dehydrogenase
MACSATQGRQLVGAAARAGAVLMAAQHQRFEPTYRAVRHLIASGILGEIHAARFDCMQNLHAYAPPGHWLYDGALAGGGVVISLAVHRLDLLRFVLGDDVVRVQAVTRTRDPAFINGAEDQAAGTLEFGQGTIGEFFATYSGYRMPYGESFMIFGERGAVHALPALGQYVGPAVVAAEGRIGTQPMHEGRDQYTGFIPVEPDRSDLPTDNPYENEVLHFVQCCRTGARPLSDGSDNVRTLAAIDAIYESARTGSSVHPAI